MARAHEEALKTDCRYFRSDRPCRFHKDHGVVCDSCREHYDPLRTRILVVKLAAVGDVLRTTALLPSIHRGWAGAHVTWITSPAALPLFAANGQVDRALPFDGGLPPELVTEHFDVVLNPDPEPRSCALAGAARTPTRRGFVAGERGEVQALCPAATRWLNLGLRDDLKQANTATYQELVAAALGLDYRREEPCFPLQPAQREKGARLKALYPPAPGRRVIGLNTGAGRRWRYKRWTPEGFEALARRLMDEGHSVFLLGGPEEAERNAALVRRLEGKPVDTGADNALPVFAGIVDACDLVVTGDTLALHVAVARQVPVVALFGPTSWREIDLYDRGEALASDLPCRVCYRPDCDVDPDCMQSILPDRVHAAVQRQAGLP